MKVVFLDIDGVLNSDKYVRRFGGEGVAIDPERMQLLKQIIDATGAEIVLSTSWRGHWDMDPNNCDVCGKQINDIFSEFGLQVFDKTPRLCSSREQEIECWLNEHPEIHNFLVLDDAFLSADFLKGHFVKTSNYRDGLDQENVTAAIEILAKFKKIFVVSDIHGHYMLLKEALDNAEFDDENSDHLLVCCGDYFDRGNENVEVLKFFERLKHKVLLRGNHEDLLKKFLLTGKVLPHHYINGTMQTLQDFFGKYSIDPADDTIDFSGKTRIVDRVCEFIDETINSFETENYVFVHGWLPDTASEWRESDDNAWEKARWIKWTEKYNGDSPIEGKTLICGHMPTFYADKFDSARTQDDASIFHGNGLIAIDAGTYDTKKVNVLVIEDKLI